MSGETSQLAGLLSAAGVATWEWNARTDRVSSSQGIAALFGLPLGDFAKSYEEFLALVHPDDRHLLVESIGGVLEGKAESYALEQWSGRTAHPVARLQGPRRA
jgi:PAS domain-containing protein